MTIEETFWEVILYLSLAARTIYQDKVMMAWIIIGLELYFFYRLGEFIKFRKKYY